MKKILLALMLPLSAFAYGNGPYPQPGGGGFSTNNVISIVNSGQTAAVTNGQDGVSLGAANDKTNTFGGELVILGKRVKSGINNNASGAYSFVGGGVFNTASGLDSFVAGGEYNTASGLDSFVSGNGNTASGLYSFAAGQNALATNDTSFVWSPRSVAQGSDSNGTFTVNASATRLFGGPIYGDGGGLTNVSASQLTGQIPTGVMAASGALSGSDYQALLEIATPYAWFNADTFNSYTNGQSVTSWPDYSLNGNNLSAMSGNQATFSATGVLGQPSVCFNGSGLCFSNANFFPSAANTNLTIFLVYVSTNMANLSVMLDASSSASTTPGFYFASCCISFMDNKGGAGYFLFNGKTNGFATLNGATEWGNSINIVGMRYTPLGGNLYSPDTWRNGRISSKYNINSYPLLTNGIGAVGNLYIGGYVSAGYEFKGYVSQMLFFTNALTDAQVAGVNLFLDSKYHHRNKNVLLDGDSITIGAGALPGSNFMALCSSALPDWAFDNIANGARTSGQEYTNQQYWINTKKNEASQNIAVLMIGANDANLGYAYTETNILNYFKAARKAGWKTISCTIPSFVWGEVAVPGYRTNLNNWITANWTNYADALCDYASDPMVGPVGSYTNTVYFYTDGAHLLSPAYTRLTSDYLVPAILSIQTKSALTGTLTNNTTGNATTATTATNDSAGNNISTFYLPAGRVNTGKTNAVTLTSFTATFTTAFTDTNYTATATGNGFAVAGEYVSNKTTTNCVFNMTVATGLIDWLVVHQ